MSDACDPERALAALLAGFAASAPPVRVRPKADSRLCRLLDGALRAVTLGRASRFMTDFTTTLGRTIFVPAGWERLDAAERYCILRHEAVHVAQFRRWTVPGMALLYILFPLPFCFAGARAAFELAAYRESLRAMRAVGRLPKAREEAVVAWIAARFTGPDYGWMWLSGGMVRRALRKTLRELGAQA
jgi:hypothetical protein